MIKRSPEYVAVKKRLDKIRRLANELLREGDCGTSNLPPMEEEWEFRLVADDNNEIIPGLEFVDDDDPRLTRALLANDLRRTREALEELRREIAAFEGESS